MARRASRIRVEIESRNEFWRKAVKVEWEYQFPDRKLIDEADGRFLIAPDWLADLQRVAGQCFSTVLLSPADPGRRSLFRRLLPRDE
jgi:hypothetical protein